MRVQVSFSLSLVVLVLGLIPSCLNREGSSGEETDRSILPQLESISFSGTERASLLTGARGSTRDLRLTADGGRTWQVINSNAIGGVLECATFSDGLTGWAVNHDGEVFTRRSGATNWARVADLKLLSSGDFTGASQVRFVTETEGWIKESLSIWRTNDGGKTWQMKLSVLTPGVKGQPGRIYPIDAQTLIALGEGQVYLTGDGGEFWKIETLITQGSLTDVWFIDKQNGWLSGYIGKPGPFRPLLFVTRDGGVSWEEIRENDVEILPESICFVDPKEGWLAGRRPVFTGKANPSGGVLLHTTDAGKHWIPVQLGSDDPFFSLVRFADKDHGWLVGRDNLYRTEDGGRTWRLVLKVPPIKEHH